MKPSELKTLLSATIKAGHPVLIAGAPGVGKTDIVKSATKEAKADIVFSHPVVDDPTDYKGLPGIVKGQAEFLPFGNLRKLIEAQKKTVMFLDDLGQAPPAVQAAAMQLILERRINGHMVSDHVVFIAATNRKQDKAGVSGILEPVKSRFTSIIELEPDLDDWVAWAIQKDLPTELIAFIRFKPNLLHDFQPTMDMNNSPCPRTVHNVGRLMAAGVPKGLEFEVYKGAAGEGFAVEFVAFLKIFRNLPNPDKILMDPENATVPDANSADQIPVLYALCGALAHKASEQNMERIVRYAYRLPPEFSVLLVRDSVMKDDAVVNTRAFIEWSSKNKDVTM